MSKRSLDTPQAPASRHQYPAPPDPGKWGDLIIIDLSDEILGLYAQLDFFLRRSGRSVEQNDLWIAATTVATGAHLLTTDKDFDPLYPAYLDRTWIDPQRPGA